MAAGGVDEALKPFYQRASEAEIDIARVVPRSLVLQKPSIQERTRSVFCLPVRDKSGIQIEAQLFPNRKKQKGERLARLEALVARKQDEPNASSQEFSSIVGDFKSKLEAAQDELKCEREKASQELRKLAAENAKLHYRITHLIRALKEADAKISTASNKDGMVGA